MLIVSDNLNVAHRHVAKALADRDAGSIREIAHNVSLAGADVIDVNVGPITLGADEAIVWMVDQIQTVAPDVQLSIDGLTADAIIAGAERASRKPIINAYYVQSARPEDLKGALIPYAAEKGLEIMLPAIVGSGPPLDPDERAGQAQTMVEMAMAGGIPADRLYVDPVIVHLGSGNGQDHAAAVLETMRLLTTIFDPPVKTIAGVEYLSQGAPPQLRSAINRVYLAMLSALGLSAAIVDVMDSSTMRDIRLIKGLRNESLYSVSDAELK
ncbi:MAG: dihydropteroate synthase [Actinobacteria bacterium]|nr:dihydropteroate synthase [Actinomycetota bacterium]MCL5735128.1 dihydropteroate synthase [Actinomycetota bacterium]